MLKIYSCTLLCFFLLTKIAISQPSGSWKEVGLIAANGNFLITPIDSLYLFAYNYDSASLYRSQNGGASWDKIQVTGITNFSPLYMYALSRDILFAYLENSRSIVKTIDGGKHWNVMYAIPNLKRFYGFKMWSEQSGFLLYSDSSQNYIDAVTEDSGVSFMNRNHNDLFQSFASLPNNRLSMLWTDSLNGCIWSPRPSKSSQLFVTHNGGIDWVKSHLVSPSGDTNISLSDGNQYRTSNSKNTFAITPFTSDLFFYYSSDNGNSWQASDTSNTQSNITTICSIGGGKFWASGQDGNHVSLSIPRNVLLYTSNYGKTWTQDKISAKDFDIAAILFTDSLHGYAIGLKISTSAGYLLKYTNQSSGIVEPHYKKTEDLTVFPNPSQSQIQLSPSQGLRSVKIFDCIGKAVFKSNAPTTYINVSRFASGSYTVECEYSNSQILRSLFIKQ